MILCHNYEASQNNQYRRIKKVNGEETTESQRLPVQGDLPRFVRLLK